MCPVATILNDRFERKLANCDECGRQFQVSDQQRRKRPKNAFCNDSCRRKFFAIKPRICRPCGQEYLPKKRQSEYCSRACSAIGRTVRVTKNCTECREEFVLSAMQRHKPAELAFCGRGCQYNYFRRKPGEARCDECRSIFAMTYQHMITTKDRKRFCSKLCRDLSISKRSFPPTMNGSKACYRCKETKHVTNFLKNRRRTDGRSGICKQCRQQDAKRYSTKGEDKKRNCLFCGTQYVAPLYSKRHVCESKECGTLWGIVSPMLRQNSRMTYQKTLIRDGPWVQKFDRKLMGLSLRRKKRTSRRPRPSLGRKRKSPTESFYHAMCRCLTDMHHKTKNQKRCPWEKMFYGKLSSYELYRSNKTRQSGLLGKSSQTTKLQMQIEWPQA